MPQAAVAAALPQIITAGGALAGGLIQHNAAGRAAGAQQKAAQSAMKQAGYREAVNDKRYERSWQDDMRRYDDWRGMTLSQLGMDPGWSPGGGGGATPVTTADLEAAQPKAEGPGAGTLSDIASSGADWHNWRRYGL